MKQTFYGNVQVDLKGFAWIIGLVGCGHHGGHIAAVSPISSFEKSSKVLALSLLNDSSNS